MIQRETILAAMQGDADAFGTLYADTFQDMYYIALKYVKNVSDAEDVLQEAYLKAYQNLPSLREPDSFQAWLGRIVANTAKNVLARKKPMLFSEIEKEDENGDRYIQDIEDENVDFQPELRYTRLETQEIVRELIDSLSDEQRICVLMFYLDHQSIKDIAKTFSISENTVKSRLNYGRKALRKKAEELQKKGYKLYSISVLPLLLYLMGMEKNSEEFVKLAQQAMDVGKREYISAERTRNGGDRYKGNVAKDAVNRAGFRKIKDTLKLTTGKTAAAAVATVFIGAGIGISLFYASGTRTENVTRQTERMSEIPETETIESSETESVMQTQEKITEKVITEEDYPALVSGNLTKEELEFVFAYGPSEITGKDISEQDTMMILNQLCEGSQYLEQSKGEGFITYYGLDHEWRAMFSAEDINRMFAAFSNLRFTEENHSRSAGMGFYVEDGKVIYSPATINFHSTAKINSSRYNGSKLEILFTVTTVYDETYDHSGNIQRNITETTDKKAILLPDEQGAYKIIKIEKNL